MKSIAPIACILAATTAAHAGQPLEVPTDPSGTYMVLDIQLRSDGLVEVLTQRNGKSGISFGRRLVDCQAATFKYLEYGDSLDAMVQQAEPNPMAPLTAGSISTFLATYACQHAR